MQKHLGLTLLIISICAVLAGNVFRHFQETEITATKAQMKSIFPEADNFIKKSADFEYFEAKSTNENLGLLFLTDKIDPAFRGFNGEISLLVGLMPDGKIKGVLPVNNNETPAYFKSLEFEGFFNKFNGLDVKINIDEINAISGATITSVAATKDIISACRKVANEVYKIDVELFKSPPRFAINLTNLALLGFAFLIAILSFLIKSEVLKWASRISSILICGVILNTSVSLPQIITILNFKLPAGNNLEALLILIFAFLFVFFKKPVYCQRLCPFGAMQEIVYKITPKKLQPSAKHLKRFIFFRWLLLFATICIAAGFGYFVVAGYEPFGSIFTFNTPLPLFVFAAIVLLFSAMYHRFWCSFFCPTGACLELVGKISPIKIAGKSSKESEID